jgi:hypothetical protein
MTRVILESRSDADGRVLVNVDLGASEAHRNVRVIIEPIAPEGPSAMTQQQWADFVNRTAGSITDPSFSRHEQGDYETREPL